MNAINLVNNLDTISYIYNYVKKMKMKSILFLLLIINIILFFYGLSLVNIINLGSLFFVLISTIMIYFYLKKMYHKKLVSLQNENDDLKNDD